MSSFRKKIFVVLLAIWLPLFSGSALAMSMLLQKTGGDCKTGMQLDAHATKNAVANHHHQAHNASMDQQFDQAEQNNSDSDCNNVGVCHAACGGYLATYTIPKMEVLSSAHTYGVTVTQFQSYTSVPLDPPPLSRV